ncbi:MAG: zinc-binding dehydrogenase [Candidatus Poribacteria bacterium]|nr:zinc-binding dehydrogenase [Candidatus Poribacteria bacterium]
MRAIAFTEQGEINVLQYQDVAEPKLRDGEILVKVNACAVNYLDIHARRNRPEIKQKLEETGAPHILGSDIAGEIVEISGEHPEFAIGDRILLAPCIPCDICSDCINGYENLCDTQQLLGFQTDGGYAEFVKAPVKNAISIADTLPFVEAAALPIAYLTAWHMLITRAQLQARDDVLILGAGGSVGSAGLQIAKLIGARIFATASTDEKLARAKQFGADITINYKDIDFSEVILEKTNGRGVDVVLEHIGTVTWEQSINSLAKNGRLVSCGVTTGNIGEINIRKMYQKQLTIMGSALGTPTELRTLVRLAEQRRLIPIIDRTLPLDKAAEAHQLLESRKNFGKVCLLP